MSALAQVLNQALKKAILDNNVAMVSTFIHSTPSMLNTEIDGLFPIEIAMNDDTIEVFEALLKLNANVNKVHDDTGRTPLYAALELVSVSKENKLKFIKDLVNKGANVNKIDTHGDSPLMFIIGEEMPDSTDSGIPEIVSFLLEKGAKPNYEHDNWTPLTMAVELRLYDIFKALLAGGADPNYVVKNGTTALILAAHYGLLDFVKALIENGAEPDKHKEGETTPLIEAIVKNKLGIVKELIKAGANVNRLDPIRSYPLSIAAKRDFVDIIKELINISGQIYAAVTGELERLLKWQRWR